MPSILRSPRLLALLVVAVAAARMARDPRIASDLSITPDSVEYAVAAQRFATLGRCDLWIEGATYPSRYPPWFSALVLAPAYAAAPGEMGAGALPVLLFALAGVLAAWSVGKRLAGDWGGVASAALLSGSWLYSAMGREIMTDAPAAALVLWACRLHLRMGERAPSTRAWLGAGVVCAAATALRAESAALVLPFALLALRQSGQGSSAGARRKRRAASMACLLAAPALLLGATALYQQRAFGDWRRSGYMFWCPVPCDYPTLAFSLDYLGANLSSFARPWVAPILVWGALGSVVLLVRRSAPARGILLFGALGVLPASLAHLFFFAPQVRFNLPLVALACVLGGAGTAALVPERVRARFWFVPALLAFLPLALPAMPHLSADRRLVAETLARATPEDAVIVTGLDPVFLEPTVLRGTRRRVVPVCREVEYASKAVAWKRTPFLDPPPRGPNDHRAPGLFRAGARDVCEFTADERPERLAEWVREGIPVYVERRFLPNCFPLARLASLGVELAASKEAPWLGRLVPRG